MIRPGSAPAQESVNPQPIAWRVAGEVARAVPALAPGQKGPPGVTEPDIQARVQAAYRQGEAAGAQAATERLTGPLASLVQVTKELAAIGPRVRAESEMAVVQLALAIAHRVLHRELSTDPEALLGVVKSASERLNSRDVSRLRLAPADAAVVQEHRERLGLPSNLEVAPDPGLAAGSVIFETLRGEMDASVQRQLEEIERGLADRIRRRP